MCIIYQDYDKLKPNAAPAPRSRQKDIIPGAMEPPHRGSKKPSQLKKEKCLPSCSPRFLRYRCLECLCLRRMIYSSNRMMANTRTFIYIYVYIYIWLREVVLQVYQNRLWQPRKKLHCWGLNPCARWRQQVDLWRQELGKVGEARREAVGILGAGGGRICRR